MSLAGDKIGSVTHPWILADLKFVTMRGTDIATINFYFFIYVLFFYDLGFDLLFLSFVVWEVMKVEKMCKFVGHSITQTWERK